MAKEKTYLSILDQLLDHGMGDAEMDDAAERGDDLSDLTRDMAEDGSFTKHVSASAESSRTIVAKKLGDDNILNDVTVSEGKAKSNKDGLASAANESALMVAIDKLLKIGHSPARIAAVIAKCAELNLDNKQFSTDYLNRRSNDLGMGYLQPNTFMPKKPDTYESQKPRLGGKDEDEMAPEPTPAGKLKCDTCGKVGDTKICDDCRKRYTKSASAHVAIEGDDILGLDASKFGGTASVQRHAIEIKVADREEPKNNVPTIGLVPMKTAADRVREDFTAQVNADGYMIYYKGEPIGGAGVRLPRENQLRGKQPENNRKGFAADANREIQDILTGQGQARFIAVMDRIDAEASVRTAGDAAKTASVRNRGEEFDSGFINEMRVAGKTFEQIWHEACQHAGLHKASKAFHEYISRAKQQERKFAAADVDFLREKLGFKDVEVAAPAPGPLPRVAYDSGKRGGKALDGNELLREFELTGSAPVDVEFPENGPLDVEAGKPEVNL